MKTSDTQALNMEDQWSKSFLIILHYNPGFCLKLYLISCSSCFIGSCSCFISERSTKTFLTFTSFRNIVASGSVMELLLWRVVSYILSLKMENGLYVHDYDKYIHLCLLPSWESNKRTRITLDDWAECVCYGPAHSLQCPVVNQSNWLYLTGSKTQVQWTNMLANSYVCGFL